MLELQTFYEAQNCSPLNMLSNATKFVTIQCQNQKIRFFLSKTNLRRKKKLIKLLTSYNLMVSIENLNTSTKKEYVNSSIVRALTRSSATFAASPLVKTSWTMLLINRKMFTFKWKFARDRKMISWKS
jgi:hypothetical protein